MIKKCYFFVKPFESCERFKSNYQHEIIALAEGLLQLGVDIAGNVDYWPFLDGNKPLIPKSSWEDFCPDLVIVSGMYHSSVGKGKDLKAYQDIRKKGIQIVATDLHDGCFTPAFGEAYKHFSLVLKAHSSVHFPLPQNTAPWAFGLTKRIIDATKSIGTFQSRNHQVLWNFRINHGLRSKASEFVEPALSKVIHLEKQAEPLSDSSSSNRNENIPIDNELNCHSGGRHQPRYFNALTTSTVSACFGGNFSTKFFRNDVISKNLRRLNKRIPLITPSLLYQWDSYRFWESLAGGAILLHADLDEEGCIFPVPLKNMEHYLGWSFKNQRSNNKILELLKENSPELARIAHNGRQWAIENFSPLETAARLMKLIK